MWYIRTGAYDLLIFRILAGLVLQDLNDTTLMTGNHYFGILCVIAEHLYYNCDSNDPLDPDPLPRRWCFESHPSD